MSITFFGVIWIIVLIWTLRRYSPLNMVKITMLSMVLQQPDVLCIGENGIGPQVITSIVFVIWFFYYEVAANDFMVRVRRSGVVRIASIMSCLLMLVVIFVSLSINGSSKDVSWLTYMQLICYIVAFICIWGVADKFSSAQLKIVFMSVIKFVLYFGIVQFIHTCGIIDLGFILEPLMYNSTDVGLVYQEVNYPWSYPRIFSTFQEPSYCSAFLVGAFFYLISNIESSVDRRLSIIVLVEVILTFASTAYGALLLTGIVYLFVSKNKKALKYLVPLAGVGLVLLSVSGQLMPIMNNVIFLKLDIAKSGSAWERNYWNETALEQFALSPIIGVGYKNVRASYIVYSVLGQLGIVGIICWLGQWMPCLIYAFRRRENRSIVSMSLFLLGVISAMLISIPDLDFCVFWLTMYLMALTIGVDYYWSKRKINV